MRKDPYKVLGVDRTATDDEVKAAYRDLAKIYHPDNYAGSPLADLAQEKMKEINEAYDTVNRERASKRQSEQQSYDYGGDTYRDERFADIREFINNRNYYEADVRLNAVPQSERNAEWYYLKGLVFTARGWYFEASRHFSTACEMDPDNQEYRAALDNLKNTSTNYNKRTDDVGGCSTCDVCSSLICADCCCEACGGDLIRCC